MKNDIVSFCASEMGVAPQVVRRIALQAPHKYKKFQIKKRRGGGMRDVAQPAREVKSLQRAIVSFFKNEVNIHSCATAYEEGSSIAKNAKRHAGAKYILKLDFSKFFESIGGVDIEFFLKRFKGEKINDSDINFILRALCWDGGAGLPLCLCIGAPSSPFFSNAIMYAFDDVVNAECSARGIVYTRYSDDMSFSGNYREELLQTEAFIENLCRSSVSPKLILNSKKRVLVGRSKRIFITGICLSTQGGVTIGRDRKRGIRAGVKRFMEGQMSAKDIRRLKGEIAFSCDVEDGFIDQLYAWYGVEVGCLISLRKNVKNRINS